MKIKPMNKEDARSHAAKEMAGVFDSKVIIKIEKHFAKAGISDIYIKTKETEIHGGGLCHKGGGYKATHVLVYFNEALTPKQFSTLSKFKGIFADVQIVKGDWEFSFDPGTF